MSAESMSWSKGEEIDLTGDDGASDIEIMSESKRVDLSDDDADERSAKRLKTSPSTSHPQPPPPLVPAIIHAAGPWTPQSLPPAYPQQQHVPGPSRFPYPPNGTPSAPQSFFLHPSPFHSPALASQPSMPPSYVNNTNGSANAQKQVIDLTNDTTPSTTPPPQDPRSANALRKDLRKDVVCIGELQVTALVLYPIPYLVSSPNSPLREEYVPVRLMYDAAGKKRSRSNEETIRITAPTYKGPNGESLGGDDFGVVEQRVANVLGPLLAKVLIRASGTIRRAASASPILTLRILLFTPKGNVNAVAQFLSQAHLYLDHPSIPYDPSQHRDNPEYSNPHNPPPGGFRNAALQQGGGAGGASKWNQTAVSAKSVEVQRSQVDEVFASLRSGEDLQETEPGPNVATKLYPHQKKALTFLLEREKEKDAPVGKSSSLWQPRKDPHGRIRAWYNVVTQKEVRTQPIECKGAILADDMGLGKTITVVSLIAGTLESSTTFVGTVPIRAPVPIRLPPPPVKEAPLTAAHFAGAVWGLPPIDDSSSTIYSPSVGGHTSRSPSVFSNASTTGYSSTSSTPTLAMANLSVKAKAKSKAAEQKSAEEVARASRIKTKSRATLIVCPLSTVVNWEDQFKEHWAGEVVVVGGATGLPVAPTPSASTPGVAGGGGATPGTVTPSGADMRGGWSGAALMGSLARGFPTSSQVAAANTPAEPKLNSLKVYVYHGTSRRPDPNFLADFDAVITTYSTLASEFSKQTKSLAAAAAAAANNSGANGSGNGYGPPVKLSGGYGTIGFGGRGDDDECDDEDSAGSSSDGIAELDQYGREKEKSYVKKKKNLKRKKGVVSGGSGAGGGGGSGGVSITPINESVSPLQMVHWFRVVLDEAHSIKETSTIGSRACCDLVADRRLCLTGTPVQNKLDDVYALIKFLRFDPFDDKSVWTEFIGGPAKFGQPLGVARLQTIMKSITLRRTKETKAPDGKTILDLPPRRDELRYLKFDEHEKKVYDSFYDESKAEFTQMSKNNEVMKNYVGILQKILRLRQICDHYELVEGKEGAMVSEDSALSYDEIIAAISKDGLNMSRATAVFALLRESGTAQCVDCGMDLATPAGGGLQMDEGADEVKPSGKRGRKPKMSSTSRGPTRANSPMSNGLRPVLTRCQHLFCIECFRHSTCPDWPNVHPSVTRQCSACQVTLSPLADAVEVSPDGLLASETGRAIGGRTKKRERKPRTGADPPFTPSTKVKALLGDLLPFSRTNPYSANYDATGGGMDGADGDEIKIVDAQGRETDDGIVKTVVFSQWTSMLDKIEDALEAAGIRYDRLDGTMKRDDRTRAMENLKTDPRCEVLLVSLRAGGVGLNLTAARRVYLMDPYWNPAVENQAVDRIHRLGQKNPVTTVKFVIEDSIETRLLEVQKRKTQLANMTLGQTLSKAEIHQRRLDELNQLFQK